MAPSPTDISAALQSIPEKKELLRKAFGDLEEQRATIARCSGGWKELDVHLIEIHEALEKRYAEIVDKETKFEAKMAELQASLDKRESVIESREQASLARVQEQKEAAIAAIREQKRKWIEERQLLQSQSPAKPDQHTTSSKTKPKDNKVSTKDETVAKSKAKPGTKDTDDTIMKEKEASLKEKDVAGAKKILKEDAPSKSNPIEGSSSKTKKAKDKPSSTPQKNEESLKPDALTGSAEGLSVSTSKPEEEKKRKRESEVETDNKQGTDAGEEEEEAGNKEDSENENAEGSEDQAQAMEVGDEDGAKSGDEDGSDDGKDEDGNKASHKKEESSQPSVKVRPQLTSLCEDMDGPGLRSFLTSQKKDMNLIRKELPTALKCASDASQLVLKAIEGYYSSGSSSEGVQGKRLANRRSCITLLEALAVVLADGGEKDSGVSDNIKTEAKMVADLWKAKLNPKGTDQAALLDAQSFLQLIATFGLAAEYDKDELCDLVVPICTRKHVPALCRKLGLANKAPEVVERLVKDGKQLDAVTYIQEYQLSERFPPVPLLKAYLKDIRKGHSSKSSTEDKDELHMKELNAAKAVLKCIEKYKLEEEYPTEGLHKRVLQLERVNPDKKRSSDAGVSGSKKPRTNGPGGAPHSGPFRSSDRPHFSGRGTGGRNYGSQYGRGGRGGYPYPAGGSGYGASSYSHGNYQYGGGPPSYQGSYMR
eukprot:c20574_g1_i1 orf=92-2215(+)